MNFIEELYNGKLNPSMKVFVKNSQYAKAIEVITSIEARLAEELECEHKSLFLDFVNVQSEINGITAYESFLGGFILGAGFIKDTFLTDHNRTFRDIT